MGKANVTYGGRGYIQGIGMCRVVIASQTKKAAIEALAEAGITAHQFRTRFCRTGNTQEIELAERCPLGIFIVKNRMGESMQWDRYIGKCQHGNTVTIDRRCGECERGQAAKTEALIGGIAKRLF